MARPTLNVVITPRGPISVLVGIAVALVLINLGVIFVRLGLGYPELLGINRLFDLDGEANLPAFFSTLLFLINSGLLLLAGRVDRKMNKGFSRYAWSVLASVFLFLGIDENAGIHEMLIKVVKYLLDTGGVFYFAWVIPYGIATLLLAILLWPWFRNLDGHTQRSFGGSAILFLSGSIGMEMINGQYLESIHLKKNMTYQLMIAVEETLEMSGLILFAHSLLAFIQRRNGLGLVLTVPARNENQSVAPTAEVPCREPGD